MERKRLREIITELQQKEPVDKTGKKKRYGGSMVITKNDLILNSTPENRL